MSETLMRRTPPSGPLIRGSIALHIAAAIEIAAVENQAAVAVENTGAGDRKSVV